MSRALALLARLARREVEAARRELAGTEADMAQLAARKDALEAERRAEALALAPDPRAQAAFALYAGRLRAEIRQLTATLAGLEAERGHQAEALRARLVELRRLELLAERARARAASRELRREQAQLDEAGRLLWAQRVRRDGG